MSVNYVHTSQIHTVTGASETLKVIFRDTMPQSILDVGCGVGTWLKAAMCEGVVDVAGVDGADINPSELLFASSFFHKFDLEAQWTLRRRFELVLCLEVAEHLNASAADILIHSLTEHSDTILFSAACPGQPGQHHINCQWPHYWQEKFNTNGFVCDDSVRWMIWNQSSIEPWYRQNLFLARKNPAEAGHEKRLRSVVHPDVLSMVQFSTLAETRVQHSQLFSNGHQPLNWHFALPMQGLLAKFSRFLKT